MSIPISIPVKIQHYKGTNSLLLVLSLVFILKASTPDTLWSKTYGGIKDDHGTSILQTTDSGYIIGGYTDSYGAGEEDFLLIKIDKNGKEIWTKTYGGEKDDRCYSLQQSTDGGYMLAGFTCSYGAGQFDVWLVKTNDAGDTLWTKTFGGTGNDQCNSIQQTTDGGYILTGHKNFTGDVWVIKTNTEGDTLWTRTIGGNDDDAGISVKQTSDGGYIIVAYTYSFGAGYDDIWLIKMDTNGDTLWTKTIGGAYKDNALAIQQCKDGGYILAGVKEEMRGRDWDIQLIKTDIYGDTLWTKTYGDTGWEEASSVQQTIDGGYILAGYTTSFGAGESDFWLLKTNEYGDTLWTKTFGGNSREYCNSVLQTKDGGYVLAGHTESFGAGKRDVWIIKLAPDSNNILIKHSNNNRENYLSIKSCLASLIQIEYILNKASIVDISIFNTNGQCVKNLIKDFKCSGNYAINWYDNDLARGIYFIRLNTNYFTVSKKIVLIK